MNTKQKFVLGGVMVILLWQMINYTPFQIIKYMPYGMKEIVYSHGNLFIPDNSGVATVYTERFILYWFIIFIFGGLAFFIAKDKKKE